MRNKHIHIPEDSALLKLIYSTVDKDSLMSRSSFFLKLIGKFLFYFLSLITVYTFLYIELMPVVFIMFYVAYGLVSVLFALNFSHDFSHNTIFKSKKLNNFCFVVLYTLVGAHASAWKQRHIHAHHYAPNVLGYDPDLELTNIIRVIPENKYFWYHKYQHIYAIFTYMSYSLFWIFIKDFSILYSKDQFTKNKDLLYHVEFWLQKLSYFLIILVFPFLFAPQHTVTICIGFLLMHLIQSLFLLLTFFMTHHVEHAFYPKTNQEGMISTSWLKNQVLSSNDMYPFSQTANFIFGGFNNHIAHHLFPHYHHLYYPKLNRILYKLLQDHHIIPNQTSYLGGVLAHLNLLKKRGQADNL